MHTYPLLTHIAEQYKNTDLSNVLLIACQHLLNPQKKMFELLLQLGLRPENCVIIGKNYSTNDEVMESLKNMRCIVAPFSNEFEPAIPFDVWFEYKMTSYLREELRYRDLQSYDKVIVLDDGGFLHTVVNKLYTDVDCIVGIEQTSSGHHKIQENGIKFPTTSVARSKEKLILESPHIARNICARVGVELILNKRRNCNVLVSGLGHIGMLVKRRLQASGKYQFVAGYDPKPVARQNCHIMNFTEIVENLSKFDVIIGASGYCAFGEEYLEKMHPEVILISASSSDREFPAIMFRGPEASVHCNQFLKDQRLVNGGFPITFDGKADASPPAEIEFTIALLFLNVMNSARVDENIPEVSEVIKSILSMWDYRKNARKWWDDFYREANEEIRSRIITQFMSPF
jgi:S-adenosylhomocysteine hydrolase